MSIVRIIITFALLIGLSGSGELKPEMHEPSFTPRPLQPAVRTDALNPHRKLPITFVPNKGQIDSRVRFLAQSSDASFYFTSSEAVFVLTRAEKGVVLRLQFIGANPDPQIIGAQPTAARINYLIGQDQRQWHTGLSTYEKITYQDLWPGIDLVFASEGSELKYELHVSPGADPNNISLAYRGSNGLSVDRKGNLRIQTALGVFEDRAPVSFQIVDGVRISVASRYRLANGKYGFTLGRYDPNHPLVIDPVVAYSTYLGGAGNDHGLGIAVDASSNTYITGTTTALNFPTTIGAFDTSFNGGNTPGDLFVTKLNADGLVYSTYLGGSGIDQGNGIAVDATGSAYITGSTGSTNFPTTVDAFDASLNGPTDAFVAKLSADGSALIYSSYLGGSLGGCLNGSPTDEASQIAVDGLGNAYVVGTTSSRDFPTTPGAFDTTHPNTSCSMIFVTKLNSEGSALVYSTFLGTSGSGNAIAVAPDGSAYVTGNCSPVGFPTTPGALDTTGKGSDVFVTKFNADGSALLYSTFVSGSLGDFANGIAVDTDGNAFVAGFTTSADYPTTPGAFDTTTPAPNIGQIFVTKLNSQGSALIYSTYLGGSARDEGRGLMVDTAGNAYVTGQTASTNFPTTPEAFDSTYNGNLDGLFAKLNASGSSLIYSTYIGDLGNDGGTAIALDNFGSVYITGSTTSNNFPVTTGAFDTSFNGAADAFVLKFTNQPPIATIDESTTDEDIALIVDVLANDTDADGDELSVSDVTQGANGSVTINSDNTVTYTPALNFNGTDSFSYTVTDTFGNAGTASVNVTISPVNDAPIANDANATTNEDEVVQIHLGASDVDNTDLTFFVVQSPVNGTLGSINGSTVTYTPNPNFNGSDSFTFKASDGSADSNIATASLTITAVNDAPVASGDSYSTPANTTLAVNVPGVLANDTDVEGDGLSAVLVTSVSHGTLALAPDGSFTYTPNLNYSGPDSFTYHAFDGAANSNDVTVQLTVTAVPVPTPCKQEGQCFIFEYVGHNIAANGQTTITFNVTNKCKNAVRMVAIGTGPFTRIAPADGSIYNGVLGNYNVGWTRASGNPGFLGIKFEPIAKNFKSGAVEVFSITVSEFRADTTIQVKGVGPSQETFSFLLSQTSCPSSVSALNNAEAGGKAQWLFEMILSVVIHPLLSAM